jgi:hypothetical protein
MDQKERKSELVKSMISLSRLMEGGAAILPDAIINHHRVRAGNKDDSPLVR